MHIKHHYIVQPACDIMAPRYDLRLEMCSLSTVMVSELA